MKEEKILKLKTEKIFCKLKDTSQIKKTKKRITGIFAILKESRAYKKLNLGK